MIIIDQNTFGSLYGKIYKFIESRESNRFDSFQIKESSVIQLLENLWEKGKRCEAINILIGYHYSRETSLLLRTSVDSIIFSKNISVQNIIKLFGYFIPKYTGIIIDKKEFKNEYNKILDIIKSGGSKKIGKQLSSLYSIPEKDLQYICRYWNLGEYWKAIVLTIIYQNTRVSAIKEIDTVRWRGEFKQGISIHSIIRQIEKEEDRN